MSLIKTAAEIEKMRVAGRLTADLLCMISPHVQPGITTLELDTLCHRYITETLQAIPAPLHYKGFPKSICTSINHQVCHGIPGPRVLEAGDIINIDVAVIKDGFHGDSSKMFVVGDRSSLLAQRLVDETRACLLRGIAAVRPGAFLGDIGAVISAHAHAQRFSVVEEYTGHGIGRHFHEPPQVLHFGKAGTGLRLAPGMIFTIEPMINAGKRQIRLLPDGWTVVTRDHSLSAQWEHTILVTDHGCEVLTRRPEETDLPA